MAPDTEILKLQRFSQPDNWQWRNFKSTLGHNLRYGFAFPENDIKSVIVCLPGFAEFAEKYFETAHDMLKRGHAFFIMDWVGQGGSQRLLQNRQKIHSLGFENYLSDLKQFLFEQVAPEAETRNCNAPLVFLGHSMGGHLGLRYLHDNPGNLIRRGAFSAPMLSISQFDGLPPKFSAALTKVFNFFGTSYVPGAGDWPRQRRSLMKAPRHTSDPLRNGIEELWFDTQADLQIGGPTYGWLVEALRSCQLLGDPRYLQQITVPVMVAIAGADKIVSSSATRRAISSLPDVTAVELPDAMHEILMEKDEYRNQFLAKFDSFVYN